MRMKVGGGGHILEVNETLATLSGLMEGTATIGAAISQVGASIKSQFGLVLLKNLIINNLILIYFGCFFYDKARVWYLCNTSANAHMCLTPKKNSFIGQAYVNFVLSNDEYLPFSTE